MKKILLDQSTLKSASLYLMVCLILLSFSVRTFALSTIRDTETETFLLGYMRPIFKAAGLPPENAEIVIVNDPSINAFVAGGQTIFVHTGLIMKAKTVDELIFVLSHETGHIVGGHIVRGYQEMQKAQTTALISTVLGGVLAVASGTPEAGMAIMMGGQSSVMGVFTKYRQTEESSADRTAVSIINDLGYSMSGFQGIMKTLQTEERLNSPAESYLRTHPLTQTRLSDLDRFLKNPKQNHSNIQFDLVKAKLIAFLNSPEQTRLLYQGDSLPSRYALAIAAYRNNEFDLAFKILNNLIQEYPNNPYFYELKGQLYFETGKLPEAAESYKVSYQLNPDAVLIALSYAQVLLEIGGNSNNQEAEKLLLFVTAHESDMPFGWKLLAQSYDRQQKDKEADYALIEYFKTIGDTGRAKQKAQKLLPKIQKNKPIYQKLKDIIETEK